MHGNDSPNLYKEYQTVKYMMTTANTMVPLAHVYVKDQDYNVYISMCTISRRMHVFKYNEVCCQYEIFDNYDEVTHWLSQRLT